MHVDKHSMHAKEALEREVSGLALAVGLTGVAQGTNGVDEARGVDDTFATTTFCPDTESEGGAHGPDFAALDAGLRTWRIF